MLQGKSIAVVIPAYNEAAHVGDVIETLPEYVDRAYAVDDGSTDDTWAAIQRAAAATNQSPAATMPDGGETYRRVVPLRHETNRGVGAAIKTGYRQALEEGYDVVAVMGGDGQMEPDRLADVVRPVAEGMADYAKGNRLVSPDHRADMPRFRLVGNELLSLLTRLASGYWTIGDPQNGYTAISHAALSAVPIEEMYEFYGYCNDLLVKLNVSGARVADVPMPATYGDETSHIRLRTYVPRVSGMLARNFLWRLRRYLGDGPRAVAATYGLGGGLLVATVVTAVAAVAGKFGWSSAVVLATVALFVLAAAIVTDRRANRGLGVRFDG
ncbi:MAG: glycosyltransferase family 2 protein [Haloarculaceae archaeon]